MTNRSTIADSILMEASSRLLTVASEALHDCGDGATAADELHQLREQWNDLRDLLADSEADVAMRCRQVEELTASLAASRAENVRLRSGQVVSERISAQLGVRKAVVHPAIAAAMSRRHQGTEPDVSYGEQTLSGSFSFVKQARRTRPLSTSREGLQTAIEARQVDEDSIVGLDNVLPPFPYVDDGVPDGQSTFMHHLVFSLLHGTGTSLLCLRSISSDAATAALCEADHTGLSHFVDMMISQTPCQIFMKDIGYPVSLCGPQGWKVEAIAERRSSGRLARQRALLGLPVRERDPLSFVEDCKQGLLHFLQMTCDLETYPMISSSSSRATPQSCALVYRWGTPLPYFSTEAQDSWSWVQLDCRPWIFSITAYAMASYHPIQQGGVPRSWKLEGSMDGERWITLQMHQNDETIDGYSDFGVWHVSESAIPCSIFRIVSTGVNSLGEFGLQISCLELYGRVACLAPGMSITEAAATYFSAGPDEEEPQRQRPISMDRVASLPEEPLPKKGKGKKRK